MKLLSVIKKNIKFLMHHKTSTMIVLLGPLFLIIVATLAFNSTQLHGIKIGLVLTSDDENSVIENFMKNIESEGYSVIFLNDIKICTEGLKNNKFHVCIEERKNVIRFYVEPARMNLVYIILNVLSSKMESATEELKYAMVDSLIGKVSLINSYLLDSSDEFDKFILETRNMSSGLKGLSDEVISIEVNFDKDNINIDEIKIANKNSRLKIFQFESQVNMQLDSNIQKLESFEILVSDIENDLSSRKENWDELNNDLNKAYEENSCSNSTHYDLTTYSNFDTIIKLIEESEKPECSYIVTLKNTLNKFTMDLNKALNDLREVKSEITSSKNELINFKSQSQILFNDAKRDLDLMESIINQSEIEINNIDKEIKSIESSKEDLSNQILQMDEKLKDSIDFLNEFNIGFKNLSSEMNQISGLSSQRLLNPVINTVEGFDKSRSNIDYLFPTLIVFIVMFVGILLGNILISKERKSRAFFRNIISPTHNLIIPLGVYITALLIIFLQIILILFLSLIFLPLSIYINPTELFLTLVLSISIFLLLGIIIGSLIESEETSIIISILLSIVLLIFSSILLPIEAMPPIFHFLIKLNPFYLVSEIISKQFINGLFIYQMFSDFIKLILFNVVLIIGSIISFNRIRK